MPLDSNLQSMFPNELIVMHTGLTLAIVSKQVFAVVCCLFGLPTDACIHDLVPSSKHKSSQPIFTIHVHHTGTVCMLLADKQTPVSLNSKASGRTEGQRILCTSGVAKASTYGHAAFMLCHYNMHVLLTAIIANHGRP